MTVHDEIDGATLRLTLDNGKHNLLTGDMYRQLCELLTRFMNDDSLKVAILAGTEGNSFCGGDDLRASGIAAGHFDGQVDGFTARNAKNGKGQIGRSEGS